MRNERSRRIRYGLLGAGFALALAGAAIGGLVAGPGSAAPKVKVVTVSEKEFSLKLSTTKLAAGKVTFAVANKGKFPHALSISGPGVKKSTATLMPGKTARLTVALKSGTYSLWCPVGNHASLGMKASLRIAGAVGSAGATATPTPAPTSTSGGSTAPSDSGEGGGGGWG